MNKGKTLLLVSLVIYLLSCTDENDLASVTIGENFISPQTHISLLDTFSVHLSTILIDSFASSSPANLLFGRYTDDFLGEISSTPYFQMDIPDNEGIDDDAVFDSLTLVVHYNGMAYGDTLKQQSINVHEVLEEIEATDDSYIYNTSTFRYDEIPLGSKCFIPEPNEDDLLEIKLDNSFGELLMQMMKDNADEISSSEDFIDYFKGIALVPGNEDASIIGFENVDSLVSLNLYTHLSGQTRTETSYSFSMYDATTCFNSVNANRSGTEIENLETQKTELSSSETGDMAFLQGGAGLVTRVDFSELNRIMELDYRNILYRAELILKPYPFSETQVGFPKEIMLYTTDKYNRLVSEIQDDNDATVYADFYEDELYHKNTQYTFDITDFLKDELSDGYFDPENGLIICLADDNFKSSAERLIFDTRSNESYRPMLKLYFIFYN